MRILVIGRNGQVAVALSRLGRQLSHAMTCLGRDDVNAFSKAALARAVSRIGPDAIVNAAAYTAVDKAETDQSAAYALNTRVPRLLAEISAANDTPFIHLSTDYVFDGTKTTAYEPGDPIRPVSIYGASKAAGEIAVQAANPKAVILRTAWVYGDAGTNFVRRMLELGSSRDELQIVNDQIGNPTFADDLAEACLTLTSHAEFGSGACRGIFHFAGEGAVSWYGFAQRIFAEAQRRGRRVPGSLVPITTEQYPTAARRPANSRLDCTATETAFGIRSQPWQLGLETCIERLIP